jgi:hypothetical protein
MLSLRQVYIFGIYVKRRISYTRHDLFWEKKISPSISCSQIFEWTSAREETFSTPSCFLKYVSFWCQMLIIIHFLHILTIDGGYPTVSWTEGPAPLQIPSFEKMKYSISDSSTLKRGWIVCETFVNTVLLLSKISAKQKPCFWQAYNCISQNLWDWEGLKIPTLCTHSDSHVGLE